jgi:hypothetical protein
MQLKIIKTRYPELLFLQFSCCRRIRPIDSGWSANDAVFAQKGISLPVSCLWDL